jgi:hypothetical protein
MHASADTTMGRRDNMIKRLNAGILNFVKRIRLRSAGATILGGFAGLSLTANIIPTALSLTGATDSFMARWGLGGYAVYSIMIWAVGGWAAQRVGNKLFGALILGSVGLISGLAFIAAGIGTDAQVLVAGGGASLLYGAIGGMIIADALRNPPEDNAVATKKNRSHTHNKNESLQLFKFFKK